MRVLGIEIGKMQQPDHRKKSSTEMDFFSEYGDASRYKIQEVIGKGSYGVVCSAIDTHTGEKVAIKKIHDIFEHLSDAARILREIKLLRLLRHPDIVEIKHIMLPPSRREFKDIYVVFELMESDLHQVIKANDDLTREHYQFFLYQLLRALKYIHTANVYHRDLKPKNILANANCKLKICDFGLARVAFSDTPTTVFWTDYVATRWYRAPELCGSFFSKYTPAIDIWSIGCIFAEVLTGKPLFPGKNVVHQLDLMTDLLGTPSLDTISRVRNEKARRYLTSMRKKQPVPFAQKFPNADPLALRLLERLLAFDPKDRPTAEEALSDPYFKGLAKVEREPSCQPISKMEFEFERRRVTKEDVRELIFREILEYHPQLLKDYMNGVERTNFLYPSAVDQFRKQFAHLEENGGKQSTVNPFERKHVSLPRSTVVHSNPVPPKEQARGTISKDRQQNGEEVCSRSTREPDLLSGSLSRALPAQQRVSQAKPGKVVGPVLASEYGNFTKEAYDPRTFIRNPILQQPPQVTTAAYCYHGSNGSMKQDMSSLQNERNLSTQTRQMPQYGMAAKVSPDIAINIDGNPFYMTRATGTKVDHGNDRITIDTNLLQAKAPYSGVGVAAATSAAATNRKVGAVQYEVDRKAKIQLPLLFSHCPLSYQCVFTERLTISIYKLGTPKRKVSTSSLQFMISLVPIKGQDGVFYMLLKKLAFDVPGVFQNQLEKLVLDVPSLAVPVITRSLLFRCLKHLELVVGVISDARLVFLVFLAMACPLLSTFTIQKTYGDLVRQRRSAQEELASYHHKCLKWLKFINFCGNMNYIEFALDLFQIAKSLEKLTTETDPQRVAVTKYRAHLLEENLPAGCELVIHY
ncbi:OLC1v1023555C1 [Oldenlandia corymbosa var. corymbosa]|uniref:mitogen-activated protein kinase n=1 Tax=Oldenlandia corymbosa var. corymbosa TaxID=529605 RepID=A0AAV1C2L9_OLDCO|nr:OLC1v1023555C1 [Oldenlandia corymbosa var. corymbosa]